MNIAAIDLNLLVAFEVLLTKPPIRQARRAASSHWVGSLAVT